MSGVLVGDDGSASGPARLQLLPTACPLCDQDEGEPVAVGSDAAGATRDTFLAVSCPACGLVYLNPRPARSDWARLYPSAWFQSADAARHGRRGAAAVRRMARQMAAATPTARVLEIGYGAGLHLEPLPAGWVLEAVTPHKGLAQAAEARGVTVHHGWAHALDASRGAYDLVLLLYSLEHCDSPIEEMAAVRKLLRAGGRAVILTPNADSTIGSLFRGRHWTGYDFPRHQCLFGPRALRQLAERSGFLIERLGSREHAGSWAGSAENLLRDWGAPGWLRSTAPGFFAVGGLASSVVSRIQRETVGSELEAVFLKPAAT